MVEDRLEEARERPPSPASSVGFFRSGRMGLAALRRPALPTIAKRSYRRERIGELTLPFALVLMEGGLVGVVADKVYAVSPTVLALITAIPMAANLSSFFWARVAQGRRKIPLLVTIQSLMVAGVASIALLPEGPRGAWQLVATMAACRLLLGGVITVRSLIWTLNYGDPVRARVTSRLHLIGSLIIASTAVIVGGLLDADPALFPWIYSGGALIAVGGIIAFSGVRLIDEDEHLELERQSHHEEHEKPSLNIIDLFRADPRYARYQLWQFLLGVSNMMTAPPVIYIVSHQHGADYVTSLALILGIPIGMGALTLPFWARYLDSVHIVRFRRQTSWLFCLSQALTCAGALEGSLLLVALGRVVLGVAHGGGSLAWQLGHNDFASRDRVGLYMGLHVSLTGVRGCIAPFVGMWLFAGWSTHELFGFTLSGWNGIGAWELGVASLIGLVAWAGFINLHKDMCARGLI